MRQAIADGHEVVNLDAPTYAANPANLDSVAGSERYAFEQVDIRDRAGLDRVFATHEPDAVMHLAAESHVDRSIDGPAAFIDTNITGTRCSRRRGPIGAAGATGVGATSASIISRPTRFSARSAKPGSSPETTAYAPNSPYSASKAASDHLVRAWHETHGLPVVLSNCSNNYGPFHFPGEAHPRRDPERAAGRPIPVCGKGENVRDWLYVEDHATALLAVVARGGSARATISAAMPRREHRYRRDDLRADGRDASEARRMPGHRLVKDRPGHDFRYAIDAAKIRGRTRLAAPGDARRGLRRTVSGIWRIAAGGRRSSNAGTKVERLGLKAAAR